jgi:hypothetical protein
VTCTSAVLGFIASALAAAASAARICAARSSDTYMLTSRMGIGEAQKRADVVLVEPEHCLKGATSLPGRFERQGLVQCGPAVGGVTEGIEAVGMLARCAPALRCDDLDVDRAGQPRGDLFLRIEEVGVGVPRGEDAIGYADAALAPGSRVKPDQLDRFRRSAVGPVATLEVAFGGNWRFPRLAGPQKIKRSCGRPI